MREGPDGGTPDGAADEEAAWQDLIARFASPAEVGDGAPAPWPAREDLAPPSSGPGRATGPGTPAEPGGNGPPPESGGGRPQSPTGPDGGPPAVGDARDRVDTAGPPVSPGPTPVAEPAPPDQAPEPSAREGTDHGQTPVPGFGAIPGVVPAPPRIRIIRPAVPAPPPTDNDEHYTPPPPPPLPHLDPVAKGAWVALLGGPAYVVVAFMLGWAISGWAAFCAAAAFIGGFATLVLRMEDRPPGDSGPGNGAVV